MEANFRNPRIVVAYFFFNLYKSGLCASSSPGSIMLWWTFCHPCLEMRFVLFNKFPCSTTWSSLSSSCWWFGCFSWVMVLNFCFLVIGLLREDLNTRKPLWIRSSPLLKRIQKPKKQVIMPLFCHYLLRVALWVFWGLFLTCMYHVVKVPNL